MMICYKGIPTVCSTRKAKTKALKYWCHVCGRYVIRDEYHRWRSPRLIEQDEVRFMDQDGEFARAIGFECNPHQKPTTTASEFLDRLTELFADVSHLSTEELEAELQEAGIDTKKAVKRVKALVERCLTEYEDKS